MAEPTLPKLDFDVAGAREAGHSDAAIADYLAGKAGFNIAGARQAGFDNTAIIDHLAPPPPPPAVKPEAAPEPPPSGMLKGMGKAAAQTLGEIPGGVETGAGVAAKIAGRFEGRESAVDVGLMRRLDQGEEFASLMKEAPTDLARVALRQYQLASPDEKAQMRQSAINVAAQPPGALEKGGANLIAAGQSKTEAVRKAIPLTEEEEQRPSVQFTRALTGLVGYIGAAAAGGFPAVIGYAGMDAMGKTYEDAKAKGVSDDQALGAALVDGMVQGGLMTVPVHQTMNVLNKLSGPAKGKFVEGLVEATKSGATLTAFSQISQIADNAVAKTTYDPERKLLQGVGEHLGPTFAAGAVLPVAGAAATRAFRPRPRPEPAARPVEPPPEVMAAPTVDAAIEAARETVNRTPVDVSTEAAGLREFGGEQDRQQAGILQLFGGLNAGTVERADDGPYHYTTDAGGSFPLKPWDGAQREDTIPSALAEAQRAHYDQLGVKVVYFENDARVPFDGAVDPNQPDTLFLSNNPQRNAAQVGAHEMTHVLERTTLPDGTSLADVLHQQIAAGITPEGMSHARGLFLQTAPERTAFPAGAEGDTAHSTAVLNHLYRELGADIGGEAPKFQSFLPKVVDAVQARYGGTVAKDILKKLVDGIRQAVRTLRSFFDPGSEYGQAPTESQKWVSNLDQIHDTLAKMYAERYGEPLPQLAAAPKAAKAAEPAPKVEEKPAAAAEVVQQAKETPETQAPAVEEKTPPAAEPLPPIPAPEPTQLQREQAKVRAIRERRRPARARAQEPVGSEAAIPPPEATVVRPEVRADERPPQLAAEPTVPATEPAPLGEADHERLMREQAAEQVRWAVEQGGIAPEMVPQIARLYRPEAGEDHPSVAFHRAVNQWITLEEARAIRVTGGDATALKEPYTPPERTDADTLRSEPTGTAEAAGHEAAAPAPERPAGGEAGREPAGGGAVPDQTAQAAALTPTRVASRRPQPTEMLADAGEKIGGARKDRWAERGLRVSDLEGMTEGEAFQHTTKDQVWPKPDYAKLVEGGMTPEAAAMVKVIRDRMAAKPGKDSAEGRRQYIEMMGHVRDVLLGAKTADDVVRARDAIIYERAGVPRGGQRQTPEAKAARDLMFSVYKGRSEPFHLGYADKRKAQEMVERGFPAKGEPWTRRYEVRQWGGDAFAVVSKGERRVIDGRKFETRDEAEAFARSTYETATQSGEAAPLPKRPHLDSVQRTGADIRGGKDVTGDDFVNDFGFRGVEFGNWVASDERQKSVNLAYDALHDMAGVIGIPPKALSLDGKLGLAFGARGSGSAAAHYEPGRLVINLTKLSGAGSLAHEWGHALDHYFGTLDTGANTRGEPKGASGWYAKTEQRTSYLKNLRPEMAEAFDSLMSAMFKRDKTRAEAVRDAELRVENYEGGIAKQTERMEASSDAKFKKESQVWIERNKLMLEAAKDRLAKLRDENEPYTPAKVASSYYTEANKLSGKSGERGYWSRPTEMFARAFESYVFDKIKEEGNSSQYLVQGVEPERYAKGYKGNPYPAAERPAINAAFDHLFKTMDVREGATGNPVLFSPRKPGEPIDLTERIERRRRQEAGTRGNDLEESPFRGPTDEEIREPLARFSDDELRKLTVNDLHRLSEQELDALHGYIETGSLGSPTETERLYDGVQHELDLRGRGALQDRAANREEPLFSPRPTEEDLDPARKAIDELAERARRKDTDFTKPAILGDVTPWLVERAREAGLDIDTYRHSIDASAIRHMLARHGNPLIEKGRGQVAITAADIRRVPDVLAEPDMVIFGATGSRDQAMIGYLKKLEDGTTLYLEERRAGRRQLSGATMRKYPAAARAETIVSSLGLYAQNVGGDDIKVVRNEGKSSALQALDPEGKAAFSPRQTETPEFKSWFGDSKVVDESGAPLIVYHGSNRSFTVFRERESRRAGLFGPESVTSPAFFFTPDRDAARMFAEDRSLIDQRLLGNKPGRPEARPFFLKVEQPLDLGDGRHPDPEMAAEIGRAHGDESGPETWQDVHRALDDRETVEGLRGAGYDGVRLREDDGAESWAVFDPRQIKSTSNRGTFDPANADIRMSPRIPKDLTPEQEQLFKDVQASKEATGVKSWLADKRENFLQKRVIDSVDRYAALRGNSPEGYMAARLANSVDGAVLTLQKRGTLKFDGKTYALDQTNGGWEKIKTDLGDDADRFAMYVAANRAEKLKAEGRENLFSDENIAAGKTLNRGETEHDYTLSDGTVTRKREAIYLDANRRLDAFNKNALDLLVQSGEISREYADELRKSSFYIPFNREEDGTGNRHFLGGNASTGLVGQTAFKKLEGGTAKLKDLWGNLENNYAHVLDAALSNSAARENIDTAVKGGAARYLTVQEHDHKLTKAEKEQSVWFMKDGKKQYALIEDPMIYAALGPLAPLKDVGNILAVSRGFKQLLQTGVTTSPIFAYRNLINDTISTIALSGNPANFVKTIALGFREADLGRSLMNVARAAAGREEMPLRLSDNVWSAIAGGATMRAAEGMDLRGDRVKLGGIIDTPEKLSAFKDYIGNLFVAWRKAISIGEDVNRLAVYRRALEESGRHDVASFAGRDINDFFLSGAADSVRYLTATVPFLNARAQGLYKIGRVVSGSDKALYTALGAPSAVSSRGRLAFVLGALAMAGLALDAYYQDDPDYKAREETDRNFYFWFKIGDTEFRIPKGFEVGAAATIAYTGAQAFFDKEMTGSRWVENTLRIMAQNLSLNPIPQVVKPILDVRANQRATGGPIESAGMERLEPQERYTASSTLAARGVSAVINKGLRAIPGAPEGPSPLELDYLVQAYSGWLGTSLLGLADNIARSFTSEPVRPARDLVSVATQGMISTEPRSGSRYVSMLYEQGKQIEEAHATFLNLVKLGRGDEARAFAQDRRGELAKYPMFERVKLVEGQINQQVRLVENSTTLSAEQKRVKIMALTALKNRAAEGLFNASASP